jgi:hypothetical protein
VRHQPLKPTQHVKARMVLKSPGSYANATDAEGVSC